MDEHPIPDEWRIPDDLWEAIAPLLPEHKNTHRYGGGRPRKSDRVCLEAILFVLRTGCQWKALDATRFCPGSTAHDRFQEWVEAGVFLTLWEHGLMAYDDWKGIDWDWLSMDGCMTRRRIRKTRKIPPSPRPQPPTTLCGDACCSECSLSRPHTGILSVRRIPLRQPTSKEESAESEANQT